MIKAVFFDVDNTLYSERKAHAIAFEQVCGYVSERLGMDPELWKSLCAEENRGVKARLGEQAAIHNRMIRFLRILEKRGLPLRYAKELNDLYWTALVEAAEPEPGVEACLKKLRQGGLVLGVGTNMTLDWQMEKLMKLGLLEYFSYVVSSEEAGVEKPNEKFFQFCAEWAGLKPEEILFVGDSVEGDVLGAKKAGMQALWYAPEEKNISNHTGFSHFCQLKNKIPMI